MTNQPQNEPTTVNKLSMRQLTLFGQIFVRMTIFTLFSMCGFMFLYALSYFFPNFFTRYQVAFDIVLHCLVLFFIFWTLPMGLMARLTPQLIFKKVERIERLNVLGKILFGLFILPYFFIVYLLLDGFIFSCLFSSCFVTTNNLLINNKENIILCCHVLILLYVVVCVPIGLIERFKPQLFFKPREIDNNKITNQLNHESMVRIRNVSGRLSSLGKILFGIFSLPVIIMILFVVSCGFSYFLVPNFLIDYKETCQMVYYYVIILLLVCACPIGVIQRFKPQLFFKKGEYIWIW